MSFPASKASQKNKPKRPLPWEAKGKGPDALDQEVEPKGKVQPPRPRRKPKPKAKPKKA